MSKLLESSGADITIDELMIKLREPLPEMNGYLEIIWDLDEPSIVELDQFFVDNVEFNEEKILLTSEIKKQLSVVLENQNSNNSISYDLDLMAPEEILENIRCKCKDFKNRYYQKADVLKLEQDLSLSQSSSGSRSRRRSRRTRCSEDSIPKIGANCKQYLNVKDYAVLFIDDLLQEAEEKVNVQPYTYSMESIQYCEGIEVIKSSRESTSGQLFSNELASWISYLLIDDFTLKGGRELILEIINNTWNLKKTWSFCIDFKAENSDTCADFYIYEVKWSLPTMSYPIPQVTASVFFTIEVSRVKPKDCPVNVTYNFESERYKFTLEDDIQQEMFLENIMTCKLDFFKSLRM